MKIPAPNHTQTPNVLFDELMKTLKEGELRVLLIIMRQTFGWHKPMDRISLSQLAEKTGMERKSVCRSLNSLMAKGLVIKRKEGIPGKEKCWYGLIVDEIPQDKVDPNDGYETEEDTAEFSNNSYQCPKDTRPVSLGHQTSVLKTPTKQTDTKENIQKKQQQPSPLFLQHNSCYQTTAAAASLQHKTNQQQQPLKIYSCLEQIEIPQSEKEWITSRYPEDTVKNAIGWSQHPQTKITTTLVKAIKWACQERPEIPKAKEAIFSDNKKLANDLIKTVKLPKDVDVNLERDYVSIIYTQSPNHPGTYINYSDKGFVGQLQSALHKVGCMLKLA
jgi:phage replication O-like protein O